jgi:hypothetical protein
VSKKIFLRIFFTHSIYIGYNAFDIFKQWSYSMKLMTILATFLLLTATSHSKIYKWVDENGSVHFSDTPYSQDAKEVNIQGSGITVHKTEKQVKSEKALEGNQREKAKQQKDATKVKAKPEKEKTISEDDYRITSSVGKLGADIISISGRISSGPRCNDMVVTATAINDNGLKGTITDNVSKTKSFGSTIFEGNAKVAGSAEDYGFWEVDSVTVLCNDTK